jgi:ABC-type multidrug transport system permease subunit
MNKLNIFSALISIIITLVFIGGIYVEPLIIEDALEDHVHKVNGNASVDVSLVIKHFEAVSERKAISYSISWVVLCTLNLILVYKSHTNHATCDVARAGVRPK